MNTTTHFTPEEVARMEGELEAARWWFNSARARYLAHQRAGFGPDVLAEFEEQMSRHQLEAERLESLLSAGLPKVVDYSDAEIPW